MVSVLNVREVASVFRVHPETIRRAIRTKKIHVIDGFQPFRIRREEGERFLSMDRDPG